MSARTLLALLVLGFLPPGFAQDAEGCKDHPLFTRMPSYQIMECETEEFDRVTFPKAESPGCDEYPQIAIEGRKTYLRYGLKEGAPRASGVQVQRNHINAAQKIGGSAVVAGDDWDDGDALCMGGNQSQYATLLKLPRKGGGETWAYVSPYEDEYHLTIVEREAMKQDVAASDLLDAIERDGFVALYLNFDTGRATIKADSAGTLDQVAAMLKSAPQLKLEVAGHTDNVGAAESNRKLSDDRAKSVAAALVSRGIDGKRLAPKGYGADKPVADNRSEDGRAKNRRVELVKQ